MVVGSYGGMPDTLADSVAPQAVVLTEFAVYQTPPTPSAGSAIGISAERQQQRMFTGTGSDHEDAHGQQP